MSGATSESNAKAFASNLLNFFPVTCASFLPRFPLPKLNQFCSLQCAEDFRYGPLLA